MKVIKERILDDRRVLTPLIIRVENSDNFIFLFPHRSLFMKPLGCCHPILANLHEISVSSKFPLLLGGYLTQTLLHVCNQNQYLENFCWPFKELVYIDLPYFSFFFL